MHLFLCFAAFFILYVSAKPVVLLLNRESTIYSDVANITHSKSHRTVSIHLRLHRRCDNPSFTVRLSGASLYLLDLANHEHEIVNEKWPHYFDARISFYQFSYPPILDEGLHFIEVVVNHCKPFTSETFRGLCVENVHGGANVVNLPYSFQIKHIKAKAARPRWILPKRNETFWPPQLLSTRYQCLPNDAGWTDRTPENTTKHLQYEFVDQPPMHNTLPKLLELSKVANMSLINVCMVGASHARAIAVYGALLNGGFQSRLNFKSVGQYFPFKFSLQQIIDAECSYAVIGYGQWPFSYSSNYTAERFTHELNTVFEQVAHSNGTTQFFVNSMNYNALGLFVTTCPPIDFRTKQVTDMANAILKSLAHKHSIEYIDNNFIMGPLWDSARDWWHPAPKVYKAQAYNVLYHIFTSSLRRGQPIQFDSIPAIAENGVVRFDGKSVYLNRNNVLYAFPNGGTFIKMGFDFEAVKAYSVSKRMYFKFGDELPKL